MIPIRKNLESHKGQGVVWSSLEGPVRGWIEDVQVTYRLNGDREVVFIVESHKGERRRKMTQHMLYPNMTAWCEHQVKVLQTIRERIRESTGLASLGNLLEDAVGIMVECRTYPEAAMKLMERLGTINETAYALVELNDPIESAATDAMMLERIDRLILRYTGRKRRLEYKRDSVVMWRSNSPEAFEDWCNMRRRNNGKA